MFTFSLFYITGFLPSIESFQIPTYIWNISNTFQSQQKVSGDYYLYYRTNLNSFLRIANNAFIYTSYIRKIYFLSSHTEWYFAIYKWIYLRVYCLPSMCEAPLNSIYENQNIDLALSIFLSNNSDLMIVIDSDYCNIWDLTISLWWHEKTRVTSVLLWRS